MTTTIIDRSIQQIARNINAIPGLTERQRTIRYNKAIKRCACCNHPQGNHVGVREGLHTFPTGCGNHGCICSGFEA